MEPAGVLKLAHAKFNECASVSDVEIRGTDGAVITYDQIDSIKWNPLPVDNNAGDPPGPSSTKTDAEIIIDLVYGVTEKVNALDLKMAAMYELVEKLVNDKASKKK